MTTKSINQMELSDHQKDSDCTVNPETLMCDGCGVDHSEECPDCGGRGFHQNECVAISPQLRVRAAGEMMLSHAVYHLSHHKVVDRGDWLAVLLLTKPAEYVAEVEK